MAAEQNPSEITTAAIAKRMKLTQGAIFRHFPSKDSIWQAVMEWLFFFVVSPADNKRKAAAGPSPVTGSASMQSSRKASLRVRLFRRLIQQPLFPCSSG